MVVSIQIWRGRSNSESLTVIYWPSEKADGVNKTRWASAGLVNGLVWLGAHNGVEVIDLLLAVFHGELDGGSLHSWSAISPLVCKLEGSRRYHQFIFSTPWVWWIVIGSTSFLKNIARFLYCRGRRSSNSRSWTPLFKKRTKVKLLQLHIGEL